MSCDIPANFFLLHKISQFFATIYPRPATMINSLLRTVLKCTYSIRLQLANFNANFTKVIKCMSFVRQRDEKEN